MDLFEGFRYRSRDAWRAVTRVAVREARLKEIKQEILNSEKLKSYFQKNVKDLMSLRHDKALHTVKLQSHLADVPNYLVPPSLQQFAESIPKPKQKHFYKPKLNRSQKRFAALRNNPLYNMKFSGFKGLRGSENDNEDDSDSNNKKRKNGKRKNRDSSNSKKKRKNNK